MRGSARYVCMLNFIPASCRTFRSQSVPIGMRLDPDEVLLHGCIWSRSGPMEIKMIAIWLCDRDLADVCTKLNLNWVVLCSSDHLLSWSKNPIWMGLIAIESARVMPVLSTCALSLLRLQCDIPLYDENAMLTLFGDDTCVIFHEAVLLWVPYRMFAL